MIVAVGLTVQVNKKGFSGKCKIIALSETQGKTKALIPDDDGKIQEIDLADVRVVK